MNELPLVSICIPCYEMGGKGAEYLEFSFQKLASQTYTNFEVIISDHSKDNVIKNLCAKWKDVLSIKHVFYKEKYGTLAPNLNNAISHAGGEIIKVLCQDDFLLDENSLYHQVYHFVGNHNYWMVTACCHTNDGVNFYRPLYPKYHDDIHYGENTISSYTVLMFRNENVLKLDENLIWLVDVEYYKQLYNKFGLPSICNYVTVVNREHDNRTTNTLANNQIREQELKYIKEKYNAQQPHSTH